MSKFDRIFHNPDLENIAIKLGFSRTEAKTTARTKYNDEEYGEKLDPAYASKIIEEINKKEEQNFLKESNTANFCPITPLCSPAPEM